MRAEQIPQAADFLEATLALRAREPVLTNVIGSVAHSVAQGRRFDRCWWWVVRDDTGEVVGCAMRTAPWHLSVSPMSPPAAAELGRALAVADPGLPGLFGQRSTTAAVLDAFAANRTAQVTLEEFAYVLGELCAPARVSGQARQAVPAEEDLLVSWHEQFAAEAGVAAHDLRAGVRQRLAGGGLWWWTVDGEPVSMAGHISPVPIPGGAVGRIGPVFTPRRFRRRGYGAAVTAAVSAQLQRRCTTVMLFTDAANPTSNSVYQRLGFRRVADVVELSFTP